MSTEAVIRLVKELNRRGDLRAELDHIAGNEVDPTSSMIEIASRHGYDFTPRELRRTADDLSRRHRDGELSDEELGAISSGWWSLAACLWPDATSGDPVRQAQR
jgi:hypothetical protein